MAEDSNEKKQPRQTLQTIAHKNVDGAKMTPKMSLRDYFRCRNENTSKCATKSTQANLEAAAEDGDLSSDVPSEIYWQTLAEKRRLALEEALRKNENLYTIRQSLNEENVKYRLMLAEANNFITVFKEEIQDSADDTGIDAGDISDSNDK